MELDGDGNKGEEEKVLGLSYVIVTFCSFILWLCVKFFPSPPLHIE